MVDVALISSVAKQNQLELFALQTIAIREFVVKTPKAYLLSNYKGRLSCHLKIIFSHRETQNNFTHP